MRAQEGDLRASLCARRGLLLGLLVLALERLYSSTKRLVEEWDSD
jgi:hypothetical protein